MKVAMDDATRHYPRIHDGVLLNAAIVLLLLVEVATNREEDLNSVQYDGGLTEADEEVDSHSPIVDQFYEEGGSKGVC